MEIINKHGIKYNWPDDWPLPEGAKVASAPVKKPAKAAATAAPRGKAKKPPKRPPQAAQASEEPGE